MRGRRLNEGAIVASVLSVGRGSVLVANGRLADRSRNYYDSYNCENMWSGVDRVGKATGENKRERRQEYFYALGRLRAPR